MTMFDLPSYLYRIGVDTPPEPTEAGLRTLQVAQLRTLPFEDITPYLGAVPDLSIPALFDKIIHGHRGGYCFELNGLLGGALAALGFRATRSMARVRRNGQVGARSHLLWQVTIGGTRWLADCGFGGPAPLVPLCIDLAAEQQAPNGRYRFRDDPGTGERVLEKHGVDGWVPLYGFDDAWVGDTDVAAANFLCATWDKAPFPHHLMLAGFDGDTRIGLFDRQLTRESATHQRHDTLTSADALAALLTRDLRLRIDPQTLHRLWQRLTTPG